MNTNKHESRHGFRSLEPAVLGISTYGKDRSFPGRKSLLSGVAHVDSNEAMTRPFDFNTDPGQRLSPEPANPTTTMKQTSPLLSQSAVRHGRSAISNVLKSGLLALALAFGLEAPGQT